MNKKQYFLAIRHQKTSQFSSREDFTDGRKAIPTHISRLYYRKMRTAKCVDINSTCVEPFLITEAE